MDYSKNSLRVNLNKDYLKKIVYWTICKYEHDDFKKEQSSSKQSMIGGFIDRWMNRTPEFLIFDELLKDKKYSVVTDNYFYTTSSAKNAPDVIGLVDDKNIQYPFVKFVDEEWIMEKNKPFIEMKTFRENQKLITIPESQFKDEHYYALVESHLNEEYLLALFDEEIFNDKYYDFITFHNESDFIKSNKLNIITKPEKIKPTDDLGYYLLIGIYKGFDLKKYGIQIEQNDKPLYFYEEIDPPKLLKKYALKEPKKLKEGLQSFGDDKKNIPFYLDIDKDSEIILTHKTKNTLNVNVKGNVYIDGIKLSEGSRRLQFREFDKSGSIKEFATTKSLISYLNYSISSVDVLLEEFDNIIE